jgi:hypothetical protein
MIQVMDVHWVMNFRTLKAFYKYCKRKNLNPDYYDIYVNDKLKRPGTYRKGVHI